MPPRVVAYLAWAGGVLGQPASLYVELAPMVALLPLGYARAGLYPGFGLGAVEVFRRLTTVTTLVFVFAAALVFFFKVADVYSRMTFGLMWLTTLVSVPLLRLLVLPRVHARPWWSEPCLVVVARPDEEEMLARLAGTPRVGYRPLACASVEPPAPGGVSDGWRAAFTRQVVEPVVARGVRVAIVDATLAPSVLRLLQARFRHVIALRGFADIDLAQPRDLGGIFGLEYRNELLRRRNQIVKRALDLVVASVVLLATLPVTLLALLGVKLVSPGPGLFRQRRYGYEGRPFAIWKIRTMVTGAETALEDVLARDPDRRREWERGFKLRDDPRIVPVVGTLLRRFSIDELPQLWNVLVGEMSLVGPRPLPDYHLRAFDDEQRELRQRVRPGLTGLWQVRATGTGSAATQHEHDEYYVRNWSIWLDVFILVRTLLTVLRGAAPHRAADRA